MNMKKSKGITLIALVITIIVLLILAGIAVSMLSGNDGLVRKAEIAGYYSDIATIEEYLNMNAAAYKIESLNFGEMASISECVIAGDLQRISYTGEQEEIIYKVNRKLIEELTIRNGRENYVLGEEPRDMFFSNYDLTVYYIDKEGNIWGDKKANILEDSRVITFADPYFEAEVRRKLGLGTGDITYGEIKYVTKITLDEPRTTSLTDLQYLNNLQYLEIRNNSNITTLNGIASCANLQTLVLVNLNNINDKCFSQIKNIDSLRDIQIHYVPNINIENFIDSVNHLTGIKKIELNSISNTELQLGVFNNFSANVKNSLENMILSMNHITDISPLTSFTNLKLLQLNSNNIETLPNDFSNLTKLENLQMPNNNLTDLSELLALTNLKRLNVFNNPNMTSTNLTVITPVLQRCDSAENGAVGVNTNLLNDLKTAGLNLTSLAYENGASLEGKSSLTPADKAIIAQQTQVKRLYLQSNALTDISFISGLTNLEELYLGWNNITEISPIAGLTKLETLEISGNAGMSGFNNIAGIIDRNLKIYMSEENVAALCTGIKNTSVTELDIDTYFAGESNLPQFLELTGLTYLNISFSNVTSLDGLRNLTNLRTLIAKGNSISDTSVLTNLTNLEEIDLFDNAIWSLEGFSGLSHLTTLNIRNNFISNLSPLTSLPLTTIDVTWNLITDFTPINGVSSITGMNNQRN